MAVNYNTNVVKKGLALLVDAANPRSYSGTGNVWSDLSGNNNHCNWNVTPTFNQGYFTFSGTEYGTVTNSASLDFSDEQSVLIVMRHTYTSGRKNPWNQAYGGYGTWTHEQGHYFNYYWGDAGLNGSPYSARGSAVTEKSVWNFMCITRNTTSVKWHMNDQHYSAGSNPYGTLTQTSANILISRGYAGYWEGDISLIAAYTHFLSDEEVEQNFNALRGRYDV